MVKIFHQMIETYEKKLRQLLLKIFKSFLKCFFEDSGTLKLYNFIVVCTCSL